MEKSIKEYGLDYIKLRYTKFRDEFFDGDDGYLPKTMNFIYMKRSDALGQCRSHFPLGFNGPVEITIKFSTIFNFTEKKLDEVLIHEMIHAYLVSKGVRLHDKTLLYCGHGYPFLVKMAEINLNTDYEINIRNDEPLDLSVEGTKKFLRDDEVLLITKDVLPGKDGVTKIKKKDISWMAYRLKSWLNRAPQVYKCCDAKFMSQLRTRRTRVGYSGFPSETIKQMIQDNKLKICA